MDENTENPNTPEYMKRLTKKLEPSDDIVQNTLTIEGKKVHLLAHFDDTSILDDGCPF